MLDLVVRAISHALVPMFLAGMAGSAIVVVVTVVKDFHDFFADSGDTVSSPDGLN